MSNNPKFMVFHLREIIYTLTFIILFILLIAMLIIMFNNKDKQEPSKETLYNPGSYSSTLKLNDEDVRITVTVDENHINSVSADYISDTIKTMYPLISPAMDDISSKVVENQSTTDITCPKESLYTYSMLLNEIDNLLEEAQS